MDYSENELPLLLATDLCRYYTNMVLFYQNRLYTFAYHLTGNAHDAEDILQEAFVGFALFSLLLKYLRVAPERFLLGGIEMILPIAVGVIVGNVALQDPALELQLTMPRHYDRTAISAFFSSSAGQVALPCVPTSACPCSDSLICQIFSYHDRRSHHFLRCNWHGWLLYSGMQASDSASHFLRAVGLAVPRCYEFSMQIKRRALWITICLLAFFIALFMTRNPRIAETLTHLGDYPLLPTLVQWTSSLNRLLPIGVGLMLADRLYRDQTYQLLIVDEPTAGLDPEERIHFRNLLSDLGSDRTVLLSTHIVEDIAQTCQHLAIMKSGRVVFQGTITDLTRETRGKVWTLTTTQGTRSEYGNNHPISPRGGCAFNGRSCTN